MSKHKKTSNLEKMFSGYLKKEPSEISAIWDKAFVSFDANVLLNLYRYSDATTNEFVKLINSMKGKVFITNQAFLEYLRNKHKVISTQINVYDTKNIEAIKKILEDKNSHPFITEHTNNLFDEFYVSLKQEYSAAKDKLSVRFNGDDIFKALRELFDEAVQEGFDGQYLKENVFFAGKTRYAEKIPPGYEDFKEKGSDTSFEGLRRLYGDLIVWLEVIDFAKKNNKDVIFVTGDRKEDWWKSVDGETVSARPELINEFVAETGRQIVMYTPDKFFEYAAKQQNNSLNEESLAEVRQLEKFNMPISFLRRPYLSSDPASISYRMHQRRLRDNWRHHSSRQLNTTEYEKAINAAVKGITDAFSGVDPEQPTLEEIAKQLTDLSPERIDRLEENEAYKIDNKELDEDNSGDD